MKLAVTKAILLTADDLREGLIINLTLDSGRSSDVRVGSPVEPKSGAYAAIIVSGNGNPAARQHSAIAVDSASLAIAAQRPQVCDQRTRQRRRPQQTQPCRVAAAAPARAAGL